MINRLLDSFALTEKVQLNLRQIEAVHVGATERFALITGGRGSRKDDGIESPV